MSEPAVQNDITAYSIYSVEQKKRTKINPLDILYPPLPQQKYDIIYFLQSVVRLPYSNYGGICIWKT